MLHLTSTRLANWMGVSVSTIHHWVNYKGLPARRTLGRHLRFDPRRVRDFLEARKLDVPFRLRELCMHPDFLRATPPLEERNEEP